MKQKRNVTKNSFFVNLKYDFNYICFIAIVFAFGGWVIENISRAISKGIVDNRFHILPFIPVYGLIAFAAYIFGNPNKLSFFGLRIIKKDTPKSKILSNVLLFILCIGLVFLGELIVGNLYDVLFGVKLWNYSNQRFHFTPYTSLLSTIGFGLGAYLIIKFIYYPLLVNLKKRVSTHDAKLFKYFCIVLLVDMLFMIVSTCVNHEAPIYWSIDIRNNGWPWLMVYEVATFGVFIISAIMFLYGSLHYFKTKKIQISEKTSKTRFAVLIPARNESRVIDYTLTALEESFYDKDKIDIYVRVESPDDETIDICKNHPRVTCSVRTTKECGKGYVLDEMIKDIIASKKEYDAYLILDADNIVDTNFLSRMSDGFLEGYQIVVGNRNNKNPNSSATAGASGITFTVINQMNDIKASNKQMVVLTGTGYCIDAKIINELQGWPFHSLTEDVELTNYAENHHFSSCYMRDAIFFDEQPVRMRDSIRQRTRWIQGFSENTKNKTSLSFSFVGGFGMVIAYISFVVVNLVNAIIHLILRKNTSSLKLFFIAFIVYVIFVSIFTLTVLLVDKKSSKASPKNIVFISLFHPFFLITYLDALVRAINTKKEWKEIKHTVGDKEE